MLFGERAYVHSPIGVGEPSAPASRISRKGAEMNERAEVLVTSSVAENRQALCRILEGLGVEVSSCSNVSECIEALRQRPIGLVFCDDRLPNGSYRDLLNVIHALEIKPRIIVTSRTGEWQEFMEAIRLGAFDMIPLPFNVTDVERSIARVLRQPNRLRSVA